MSIPKFNLCKPFKHRAPNLLKLCGTKENVKL